MLAAVSCNLYGEPEQSLPWEKAEGVDITFADVTDNSFKVTVAPKGEATYYSYLVDESPNAVALDSSKLYAVKYSSVKQGTVQWTSEKPSYTFEVKDVKPNTVYQVYAVAGSKTGVPGSVEVKSIKTTDGVNPALVDAKANDNAITFVFSEAVAAGEGVVKARYFARYSTEYPIAQDKEVGEVEGTFEIKGNQAVVTFEGIPAGAYYSPSFPAGTFVDSANNPVAELKSGWTVVDESLAPYGVYGRRAFDTFEINAIEDESFTDPYATFVTTSSRPIVKFGVDPETSAAYVAKAEFKSKGKTVSLDLNANDSYLFKDNLVAYILPEAPEFGSYITVTIPEGAFTDMYGNSSAEWSYTAILSYGYTLDDIVGTYSCSFNSYFNGELNDGIIITTLDDEGDGGVAPLEDAEAPEVPEWANVKITYFAGLYLQYPIYGLFDTVAGTLTLAVPQKVIEEEGTLVEFDNASNYDPIVLHVYQPGNISDLSSWCGFYITAANSGWFDVYTSIYGERMDINGGIEPLTVKKSDFTKVHNDKKFKI